MKSFILVLGNHKSPSSPIYAISKFGKTGRMMTGGGGHTHRQSTTEDRKWHTE